MDSELDDADAKTEGGKVTHNPYMYMYIRTCHEQCALYTHTCACTCTCTMYMYYSSSIQRTFRQRVELGGWFEGANLCAGCLHDQLLLLYPAPEGGEGVRGQLEPPEGGSLGGGGGGGRRGEGGGGGERISGSTGGGLWTKKEKRYVHVDHVGVYC